MAIVQTGNNLSTAVLQPGWTVQDDGYGLWTGRCTFKCDSGNAQIGTSGIPARGSVHPDPFYAFMYAHKVVLKYDSLDYCIIDVDYVGISTTGDSGGTDVTLPNISGSSGLTAEPITSHIDFFTATTGIAGSKPYAASTIVDGEFVGLNGAHFSSKDGGAFRGFKDPAKPLFYGKTNYLAPTTSFSGVIYANNSSKVTTLRNGLGKTSGSNTFSSIKLLPDYVGTSFVTSSRHQLLLSQVNFEDYGYLCYKIAYEIRFNRDGYESTVYKAIT